MGEGVSQQKIEDISEVTQKVMEQAEKIEIKPEDRDLNGNLLVFPSGPLSNLPEKEWKMVRTETFKRWFGESTIVDSNNEPMLLFHLTKNDFNNFEVGERGAIYFFKDTPDKDWINFYGNKILRCFVKANKIEDVTEEEINLPNKKMRLQSAKEALKNLEEQGLSYVSV